MRHYDSINRIQDDGFLLGKCVWTFNKLDGQNFALKYNPKKTYMILLEVVTECLMRMTNNLATMYFKNSDIPKILSECKEKQRQGFAGADEYILF